ncbi:MAG: transposase [Anaerotignum sp.]|nr:transposase [Anaerotignum sp.]
MKKVEVPVWEKANLTVNEAAAYFEIGTKKIRDLARENPDATYFLWNGSKLLIKRELFEKQCEQWNEL